MPKITLQSILSGFLSNVKLNQNNAAITAAFENTLSRDGTTPNAMGAQLDMGGHRIINLGGPINPNDAVRVSDLGGVTLDGTPISLDWTSITGKPTEFPPEDHTHTESEITGLTTDLAALAPLEHDHTASEITDLGTTTLATILSTLVAGSNITLTNLGSTLQITASDPAVGTLELELVGGTNSGALGTVETSPSFVNVFGGVGDGVTNNDDAFTAAEADTICDRVWLPKGTYLTTKTQADLTKHYWGPGKINNTTYVLPGRFSFADSLPTGYASQGNTGWFSGNHVFSEPQYAVVGPNARTYDLTQKYYCSQLTPRNNWLDIRSGNSGVAANLPSGASAGDTVITLNGAASSDWVGKTVGFLANSPFVSGVSTPAETKTIVSVAGSTITVNSGLSNSYPWNGTTLFPCITFSPRTMSTNEYIKVTHSAGGDGYGSVVRLKLDYEPKATEYHVYMTGTAGQYGGDVNFTQSGVMATGWESQYHDAGFDVCTMAQVDSLDRNNDTSPASSGRVWYGTLIKSDGTRPIDATHVITGKTRIGVDTARATLMETAKTSAGLSAGNTVVSVTSVVGAVVGDAIQIGDGPSYSGTITAVSSSTVTVTPAISGTIGSGTIVKYTQGGAALSMSFGQRIFLNSSFNAANRGGDPQGIFPTLHGNTQGDMYIGTANYSGLDAIVLGFNGTGHSGASTVLKVHPAYVSCNNDFLSAGIVQGRNGLKAIGSSGEVGNYPTIYFGGTSAQSFRYNTGLSRFEFISGGSVIAHFP